MTAEMLFDKYIAVDWSARSVPSAAKLSHDAIWVGEKDKNGLQKESYFRTRFECIEYLLSLLSSAIANNERIIIGYDLDFGFPAGFIDALDLRGKFPKWRLLWNKLSELIIDNPDNSNNRFEVAAYLNSLVSDSSNYGPLWGCPVNTNLEHLSPKSPEYPYHTRTGHILRKFRWAEMRESKAQPVWKLIGSASVGGQTLVGIPAIHKLRFHPFLEKYSQIWPFETGFMAPTTSDQPLILHIEIWPGIFSGTLDSSIIKDQAQVRATVNWLHKNDMENGLLSSLGTPEGLSHKEQIDCITEEGWIIGMGTMKNKQRLSLGL